jgi:uncharacterized protein YndB with AHSA1/START domain
VDEGYSYGGDRTREVVLEPVAGGRFFDRFVNGNELRVVTVMVCSPPERIVFTWRSPDWQAETEVDVRFHADDIGTAVELEHRGFERLGPDGAAIAKRWANGWPRLVEAYATRAGRSDGGQLRP